MNKVTRDILEHYRTRTIAAFILASGASVLAAMGYLFGLV